MQRMGIIWIIFSFTFSLNKAQLGAIDANAGTTIFARHVWGAKFIVTIDKILTLFFYTDKPWSGMRPMYC